jgi:hypothetical protein
MTKTELITRQQFLRSSSRLIIGATALSSFGGLGGCTLFSGGAEQATVASDTLPAIVTSRIKMVTIGATDLAKTEDWYGNWLDYLVVERGNIGDGLARAWGTPSMAGRPYILMQPASGADVFIRAALIDEVPGYKAMTTTGWNAFEIVVEDAYALNKKLESSPFEIVGSVQSIGGNSPSVHAMQMIGPSQEVLYLTMETGDMATSPLPSAGSFVDRVFIVILAGPDAIAINDFYMVKLGMMSAGGADFKIPIIARAQGLPENYQFELSLVAAAEPSNLIEIDKYSDLIGPRPRADGQLPPGNAMVSFSVSDLSPIDVDWISAPLSDSSVAYNGSLSAAVTGPAGEITELIEEQ